MVGDMIVNLYLQDVWRKANTFNTRTVFPSDKHRVLDFLDVYFPNEKGWAMEVEHGIQNGTCSIAVLDGEIVGFACYDCTGKGYFGPFGVREDSRSIGVGTELFYDCLDSMKRLNYGYAIIGWVDGSARGFYEKTAKASYIQHSEPNNTLYKRRIMTVYDVKNWKDWDNV